MAAPSPLTVKPPGPVPSPAAAADPSPYGPPAACWWLAPFSTSAEDAVLSAVSAAAASGRTVPAAAAGGAASVAASSPAPDSAPGSVGECGSVYSEWWVGVASGATLTGTSGAGLPAASEPAAGLASDHCVSHSASSWALAWAAASAGSGTTTGSGSAAGSGVAAGSGAKAGAGSVAGSGTTAGSGTVAGCTSRAAASPAVGTGSSAVVGAAGPAGWPNPATVGIPVVPAAAAEAAELPPDKAPSAGRCGASEAAPEDRDRFISHQTTPTMTTIRMIQKTMSTANPLVCHGWSLSPDATLGDHRCPDW